MHDLELKGYHLEPALPELDDSALLAQAALPCHEPHIEKKELDLQGSHRLPAHVRTEFKHVHTSIFISSPPWAPCLPLPSLLLPLGPGGL